MSSLFVSYAHADGALVDRLVADLHHAGLPVTFDKWLLQVGDSIIERLSAAVTQADAVVVVLSPASVASNWVRKELALALSMEVGGAPLRVLPALAADCELPPALRDKLHADFRTDYVEGLAALVRALRPPDPQRAAQHLDDRRTLALQRAEFEALLEAGAALPVRRWLAAHPAVLAGGMRSGALVPWGGPDSERFVNVDTNSGGTWLRTIVFGPVDLDPAEPDWVDAALQRVQADLQALADSLRDPAAFDRLRLQHVLRLGHDPMALLQLEPGHTAARVRLSTRVRLVAGRRADYDETPLGQRRLALINAAEPHHDLQSYDRFLDHFDRLAAGRAG